MTDQQPDDQGLFDSEEVWFRKDGTTVLRIDGVRYVLRRPKFKELRTLREQVRVMDDQLIADIEPLNVELTALKDAEGAEAVATARELAERVRVARETQTVRVLTWFRDELLTNFADPAPNGELTWDDLPGWIASATFFSDLSDHWASVPRRPGVA